MSEERDSDALSALVALAARLRDTAGTVAERADAAARSAAARASDEPRTDGGEAGDGQAGAAWSSADFGALIDFAGVLRESVPAELRERLSGSLHETLLSARALIDWYLEREAAAQSTWEDVADGQRPEAGGDPASGSAAEPGDEGQPS